MTTLVARARDAGRRVAACRGWDALARGRWDVDGAALLALACNALARTEPAWYADKGVLVWAAVAGRARAAFWRDRHGNCDIILLETAIALPEGGTAQMAFHLPQPDDAARAALLLAPGADGRRWRRQLLTDRVDEVYRAYLAQRRM